MNFNGLNYPIYYNSMELIIRFLSVDVKNIFKRDDFVKTLKKNIRNVKR